MSTFARLLSLIGAPPSPDRARGGARVPGGRIERGPDGRFGVAHLEIGAGHQRRRGGRRDHLGPRPRDRARGVPLSRAPRHPPGDLRHPGRPACLVLRRDRAARPGPPGRTPERRPAGQDRGRHRDARGLLRPGHLASDRGGPRGGLRGGAPRGLRPDTRCRPCRVPRRGRRRPAARQRPTLGPPGTRPGRDQVRAQRHARRRGAGDRRPDRARSGGRPPRARPRRSARRSMAPAIASRSSGARPRLPPGRSPGSRA